MKWITREKARVDRIACPWLIRRFIDPKAVFLFVDPAEVPLVADRFAAVPFDIEGVFWSHRGERCTFDTMIEEFGLRAEALDRLALIVRGADTAQRGLTPESAGLYAYATGFQATSKDDFENMARQFPAYDALYAYCKAQA